MNIFYLLEHELLNINKYDFLFEIKPIFSSNKIKSDISIKYFTNPTHLNLIIDKIKRHDFINRLDIINGYINLEIDKNFWIKNLDLSLPSSKPYFEYRFQDNRDMSYDNILFKYHYIFSKTYMILKKYGNVNTSCPYKIDSFISSNELDMLKLLQYFYKYIEISIRKSCPNIILKKLTKIADIFLILYYKENYASFELSANNIHKFYIVQSINQLIDHIFKMFKLTPLKSF
ncbi:MAG: DALR anticodon-binding domain-containing protein [Alphaproteobacteria bacterium]